MDSTNCSDISIYTTSTFLHGTMSCQLLSGFISILGIFATRQRVFLSILLDSAFKEYLICCYCIHLIQSLALFLLQSLLLFQHFIQPPCFGTIPSWLCTSLRLSTSFSTLSLPMLNLTLALFRCLSFFGGVRLRKKETVIRRLLNGGAIFLFCLEFYWKLCGLKLSQIQVSYCIASAPNWAAKSNIESIATGVFEGVTICSAFALLKLYQRENRLQRSYIVSVNLRRKQLMLTMQLFLPYSLLHAFSFVAFAICGAAYRKFFSYLDDPYYSAGSGFFFIPMYFTAISPWLVYWIVLKSERNRLTKISDLCNLESHAKKVYFENLRSQWECQRITRTD